MSNFDVMIRFRAKDETRAGSESAKRRLRAFEKQAKAANRAARNTAITHAAMAKSTNAAAYAMGTLTRYVGPAVVGAAMLKTVKSAAHFEEALFGIQKKSGATAEQLGKVKEEIFELASRMPSSVDGIAAAYERHHGNPLESEHTDFGKRQTGRLQGRHSARSVERLR